MPNSTSAGLFFEEGREPPGYADPRDEPGPGLELPAKSAPRADWVDQAVKAGVDPDEAAGMTKPELAEAVKAAVPPLPLGSGAPGG
jgi:hypothetical protein